MSATENTDLPVPDWVTERNEQAGGEGLSFIMLGDPSTNLTVETGLEWEPVGGAVMAISVEGAGNTDQVWLQPAQARFVIETLTKMLETIGE